MHTIASKFSVAILALTMASAATAQTKKFRSAGEALAVIGTVSQQKGSAPATLVTAGAEIPPGSTLTTQANSSVRLRMADNSYFALPADSALQIEKLVLPRAGKTKEAGTAVFSLLRGGFRTITGLIGKISTDSYQIKTPVATIGVRGTEFAAFMCQACVDVQSGLYIEVHAGVVVVANSNGSITLAANEYGFVANVSGSSPEKIGQRPVVFEINGGIFAPEANISYGASASAGPDGVEAQPEPPRIEPPVSPSSP